MSEFKLGYLVDPRFVARDAVHVAIIPVIAGDRLSPGARVTVENGITIPEKEGKCLGIVDPFLKKPVEYSEGFWLLMNPGEAKNLRHSWAHPVFSDEPVLQNRVEADDDGWNCQGCE